MTYRIEIERRAHKALGRLPKGARIRVITAIDSLAEDPSPRGGGPVRAASRATYRVRVGDYRVIYALLGEEEVTIVARVVRRSETSYRKPG